MNRIAQGLVLVLLGAAALGTTLASDLYLNYVQELFRPFLIAAGAVLVVLGAVVIAADLRAAARGDDAEDAAACGHGHGAEGGPRVAWLLLLPVVSVFVVAPPALGAYTASAQGASSAPDRVDLSEYRDDPFTEAGDGPVELEMREFVSRAWTDEDRAMSGKTIELTGFTVPHPEGEGWYLARLEMACCAADAVVNRVLITDEPAPETDSWWRVRGTWDEPEGDLQDVRDHRFTVEEMEEVENPPDPYE
ncbi:TIGR03943 family protein [Nocardiopsis sp. RSe5-2]|uniref:TIGR03943 family protein n=1 Tax=Nocardiopsis endophytica TaxID=3018445 RepID=A0ABT4UAD1_9ACTN|nr:TIGR03943 family protein [Nocardiopsis endophytica]MDA2813918.1 TIGR03943 family protein [Nocardiopsis endophytica]